MNRFGNKFTLTTFGESHGVAVGGIIDGCPAGLELDFGAIDESLRRRRQGDGIAPSLITTRQETDRIEWLSGLLEGKTLGTPIAFLVRNNDINNDDYQEIKGLYRPGHADYTYQARYGTYDWRGGGRASARETVARVIAGEIARQCLVHNKMRDFTISAHAVKKGTIECTLQGVPAGIGNPIFAKLNATFAYAMMSIPSAIGFEIGAGFAGTSMSGEGWRDEWNKDASTQSNHCGGIQGGISNGMPITFRVAFHAPTTTPGIETKCLDETEHRLATITPSGRHDLDQTSRLPVIVEAMASLTLMDLVADI